MWTNWIIAFSSALTLTWLTLGLLLFFLTHGQTWSLLLPLHRPRFPRSTLHWHLHKIPIVLSMSNWVRFHILALIAHINVKIWALLWNCVLVILRAALKLSSVHHYFMMLFKSPRKGHKKSCKIFLFPISNSLLNMRSTIPEQICSHQGPSSSSWNWSSLVAQMPTARTISVPNHSQAHSWSILPSLSCFIIFIFENFDYFDNFNNF